jgi:hypothetical protein
MAVAEDFGSDIEMEDEEEADAGEELEEPASEPENGR